jgi:predicted membrane-bound spermidine synthase
MQSIVRWSVVVGVLIVALGIGGLAPQGPNADV